MRSVRTISASRTKSQLISTSVAVILASILPAAQAQNLDTSKSTSSTASSSGTNLKFSKSTASSSVTDVKSTASPEPSPEPRDGIGQCLDQLTTIALSRSAQVNLLDEKFFHYKSLGLKIRSKAADMLNYAIMDRGDSAASEVGDVILDEKVKIKHGPSADFARQRETDSIHLKLSTILMQISMGLGMTDQAQKDKCVDSGMSLLKDLVGQEAADATLQNLIAWNKQIDIPEAIFSQSISDVDEHQQKLKTIVAAAVEEDPSIQEIKRKVHKYNHHSKLYRVSNRVINTTLSLSSLAPSFIGTGSQVALGAYTMATGGPVEDKLVSELYLAQRLQSRCNMITEQAQIALDKYEIAVLTRNRPLLTCSQGMIKDLTNEKVCQDIFGPFALPSSKEPIVQLTVSAKAILPPAPVTQAQGLPEPAQAAKKREHRSSRRQAMVQPSQTHEAANALIAPSEVQIAH